MPNPDEELEERLARLKGVDVDQVRHPGKGLANDPLETSQDDSLLLHDHSSYTIVNTGDDQDPEGLVKEVSNINKEVSIFRSKDPYNIQLQSWGFLNQSVKVCYICLV